MNEMELIQQRMCRLYAECILINLEMPGGIAKQAIEAMSLDEVDVFRRGAKEVSDLSVASAFMAGHVLARLATNLSAGEQSQMVETLFDDFVTSPGFSENLLFANSTVRSRAHYMIKYYSKAVDSSGDA